MAITIDELIKLYSNFRIKSENTSDESDIQKMPRPELYDGLMGLYNLEEREYVKRGKLCNLIKSILDDPFIIALLSIDEGGKRLSGNIIEIKEKGCKELATTWTMERRTSTYIELTYRYNPGNGHMPHMGIIPLLKVTITPDGFLIRNVNKEQVEGFIKEYFSRMMKD